MTAVGCGTVEVNPSQHSIKQREKCGLVLAYCPCFETLASLAPQHEVVVFQQVRPHPRVTASPLSLEEAANGSRECAPDDRLRGRLEGWAALPICDFQVLVGTSRGPWLHRSDWTFDLFLNPQGTFAGHLATR